MTIETSFVYGRALTANDTWYPIALDDPIGNTGNLKYCVPYAGLPVLFSFEVQSSPTGYGTAASGEYWVKPQHNGNLLPVARNSWSFCSMWMVASNTAQFDKKYILKDAYSLSSCINVLLQQIDTNVTHDCTSDYSSFLYGENALRVDDFTLLITPKSNILVNEYDKPASKATITLYNVLDMLKSTLQCYWFVEDGKLKIEHVKYFRNGGSYSSPTVETDLTTKFGQQTKPGVKISVQDCFLSPSVPFLTNAIPNVKIKMLYRKLKITTYKIDLCPRIASDTGNPINPTFPNVLIKTYASFSFVCTRKIFTNA